MRLVLLPPLAALCCLTVHAGQVETAIVAAMKISEQPSYSWVSTIDDDVQTYDVHGMTRADGYTRLKMPMTASIRRRLGRNAIDSDLDVIYHGKSRCVIQTAEGWKSVEELPWLIERRSEFPPLTAVSPSMTGIGFPGQMTGGLTRPSRRAARSRTDNAAADAYSSLQLSLTHPHEDLSVIVSSHAEFHCNGDTVHGTLNEMGALLLLVRDDDSEVQPLRAAGTFKLWLRNGVVTKYQVKLEGELARGARTFEVRQTTTTTLRDLGVTKFQVPDEALHKLGE